MFNKSFNAKYATPNKKITSGQIALLFFLLMLTILVSIPILLVFVSSVTNEAAIATEGFTLFPSSFSLNGFKAILKYGRQLFISYGVTVFVTISGTILGLLIMSMCAYTLTIRDFPLKKFLTVFLIIPMLFSGGQLSKYIIYTSVYHLKDSFLLLILPLCVQTMYVFILRTYIQDSIPMELRDAARIDGAGDFTVFFRIVFPLMKPALSAVGFMLATMYWNEWQNALLFIDSNDKKPLQLLLINIQKSIDMLLSKRNIPPAALAALQGQVPQYSATMATVIIVIAPVMIAYPLFQRYIVKGFTMGSVKG